MEETGYASAALAVIRNAISPLERHLVSAVDQLDEYLSDMWSTEPQDVQCPIQTCHPGLNAQKQFFLRRSKAYFRASEFSTISRGTGIGILGKEGF